MTEEPAVFTLTLEFETKETALAFYKEFVLSRLAINDGEIISVEMRKKK